MDVDTMDFEKLRFHTECMIMFGRQIKYFRDMLPETREYVLNELKFHAKARQDLINGAVF